MPPKKSKPSDGGAQAPTPAAAAAPPLAKALEKDLRTYVERFLQNFAPQELPLDDARLQRAIKDAETEFSSAKLRGAITWPKTPGANFDWDDDEKVDDMIQRKRMVWANRKRVALSACRVASLAPAQQFDDLCTKVRLMLRNLREGDCPFKAKRVWLEVSKDLASYQAARLFVETHVETYTTSFQSKGDHLTDTYSKFVAIVTDSSGDSDSDDSDDFEYRRSPHKLLSAAASASGSWTPTAKKFPVSTVPSLVQEAVKRGVIQESEKDRFIGLCKAWMENVMWEECMGLTMEHRASLGTWNGEFWESSNVAQQNVLGRGVSGVPNAESMIVPYGLTLPQQLAREIEAGDVDKMSVFLLIWSADGSVDTTDEDVPDAVRQAFLARGGKAKDLVAEPTASAPPSGPETRVFTSAVPELEAIFADKALQSAEKKARKG